MEAAVNVFTPSFITYSILVSTLVAVVLPYLFRRCRMVRLLNKIPGPKSNPIFGSAFEMYAPRTELFQLLSDKYCLRDSALSLVWVWTRPMCFLYKAKAVEVVLTSQNLIEKSSDYDLLHPWLGVSLLTSTGKKWQQRRKMLTPTFHFKILEDYVSVFNQESFKLVSILEKKEGEKSFDISKFITLCTLDIILETAMGKSIDVQNNSDSNYVKAIYEMSALFLYRAFRPWLLNNFVFKLLGYERKQTEMLKIIHSFSNEIIQDRKKEYQETLKSKNLNNDPDSEIKIQGREKKRLSFLDLLIELAEENHLSDEDIRAEVDTFMFEGHDTTAAAINWFIYLMGCHPEAQELVHDELVSIFGASDRAVATSDLNQMKYLECCIKEVLRLFPSVPFIGRKLTKDVVIDGYTIPSGTTASLIIYRLHRDPDVFPDPESFQPERFLPENSVGRHPFAYLPFSGGPRNCIGQKFALMEEKIILANFFRKYRVESDTKQKDLKILGELILRSEDEIKIKLHFRN